MAVWIKIDGRKLKPEGRNQLRQLVLNTNMLHLGDMAQMQQLTCDEKIRRILEQRRSSQTELHRNVFRALNTRPNTVIKWRDRFAAGGLAGLEDRPRPGAPR